ncbi:TPA: hypothetical protein ACX6SY_003202 [Photobacterium damselae]
MFDFFSNHELLGDISTSSHIEQIFYDLPLFMIAVVVTITLGMRHKIPKIYVFILLIHCLLPFFLNGVLFDASYMPDQYKYWSTTNAIRSGEVLPYSTTVKYASYIFAFFPMPFALTVTSLGFYNCIIFVCLFSWLWKNKVLTNQSALFYLLYPSLALYFSLSLRDGIIFSIMMVSTVISMRGRFFLAVLLLSPLILLKFQNFFIMLIIFSLYHFLGIRRKGLKFKRAVLLVVLSMLILICVYPFLISTINYYRQAMFIEDGGVGDVSSINSIAEFIVSGLFNGLYFIIKPLPTDATSALQMVQSLENIGIVYFIYRAIKYIKIKNIVNGQILFWCVFLIISSVIYGLVIFNFGTAARYKFPFVTLFYIVIFYELKRNSNKKHENTI